MSEDCVSHEQKHNQRTTAQYYRLPKELPLETISWVPCENGDIPENAVEGGTDNGQPLYVVRTHFQGGTLPGKLLPSVGFCHVSFGGREFCLSKYEVLTATPGSLNWISASNGDIVAKAVVGGQSEKGELLYIGRCKHNQELIPGKIHPSSRFCYIPFGGKEFCYQFYETLCVIL